MLSGQSWQSTKMSRILIILKLNEEKMTDFLIICAKLLLYSIKKYGGIHYA